MAINNINRDTFLLILAHSCMHNCMMDMKCLNRNTLHMVPRPCYPLTEPTPQVISAEERERPNPCDVISLSHTCIGMSGETL